MVKYDISPEIGGFRTLTISNGSGTPLENEILLIERKEGLESFNRVGPYAISGKEGEWEVIYHKPVKENVPGMTSGVPNGRY